MIFEELNVAQQKAVIALEEVLLPEGQKIERSPKTTKGHYGRYMALLSPIKSQYGENFAVLAAVAALRCGADSEGIQWALKLI